MWCLFLLLCFPEGGSFCPPAPGADSPGLCALAGQQGEGCCRGSCGGSAPGRCRGVKVPAWRSFARAEGPRCETNPGPEVLGGGGSGEAQLSVGVESSELTLDREAAAGLRALRPGWPAGWVSVPPA